MQTQQRDRRRRVSCRRRRILKRLPPRPQYAERVSFVRLPVFPAARIKESSRRRIVEFRHHRVPDRLRKAEVAEIRRRLVGIETGNHRKSIVIKHAGNVAPLRLRIGVSNHMLHPALRIPSLGKQPVQRAQRKTARLR